MGSSFPNQGSNPAPRIGRKSLNCWTTREVPPHVHFKTTNNFASSLTVSCFFKFINGFELSYFVHLPKWQRFFSDASCHHLSLSLMQDPLQAVGIQNSFPYLSTSSNPHHFLITHESIFFLSQLLNFLFFCSYLIPILF